MLARCGFFLLIAATLVSTAECSHNEAQNSSKDAFSVALLTPGAVSEAGWNAAAFDGLRLIKKSRRDARFCVAPI